MPLTAHASGRRRDVPASTVFVLNVWIDTWFDSTRIETRNLSAGGDTVMNVQRTSDGAYVAGNDDCAGSGTLGSCVTLTRTQAGQYVTVLVRAYSSWSAGSAVLTFTQCRSTSCYAFDVPIARFAGRVEWLGERLPAGTRVTTVRQAGGAGDTVLLLVNEIWRGIAYDDNHGLISTPQLTTGMSELRPPVEHFGSVVVGVPQWMPEGPVTLIWDTDSGRADWDGDGVGNSLELVLGTYSWTADSDGDGLTDGEEIFGAVVGGDQLQFPAWGADPLHQDLFVELDWDLAQSGPAEQFRVSGATADAVVALFAADPSGSVANPDGRPGIAAHLDIGLPSSHTRWGDWGGAGGVPGSPTRDNCAGFTPTRANHFEHGISIGGGGNGGRCFQANFASAKTIAHELGHILGLTHAGRGPGTIANCKPNYASLMSYAGFTAFSWGRFAGTALWPTALQELDGLGSADPAVIGYLEQWPFEFTLQRVNGTLTGAVDWNRDGLFENGARGAPNLMPGASCEVAMPHRTGWTDVYSQAFLGKLGGLYYLFGVREDSSGGGRPRWGVLEYRTGGSVHDCDEVNDGARCPGSFSTPRAVLDGTSAAVVATGPGAAASIEGNASWGVPVMLIVYKRASDSRLVYQLARPLWGQVVFTSPALVDPNLPPLPIEAEPTLATLGDAFHLFVPVDGLIRQYRMPPLKGFASRGPALDPWGAPLAAAAGSGLGVVTAYGGGTEPAIFGAFRAPPADPAAPLAGRLRLVRRQPDGRWVDADVLWHPAYGYREAPVIRGTPRLGYTPFESDPTVGRFTFVFHKDSGFNHHQIAITEGNQPPSPGLNLPRELVLATQATDLFNSWGGGDLEAYSLLSEPDGLRATVIQHNYPQQTLLKETIFVPFADGVFDGVYLDSNDFAWMSERLACTVKNTSCPP